jgi:hypothetical protein
LLWLQAYPTWLKTSLPRPDQLHQAANFLPLT